MRRYVSPEHIDCWVECPGLGSAMYVDPPGLCLRECGESSLANLLTALFLITEMSRNKKSTIYLRGESRRNDLLNTWNVFNNTITIMGFKITIDNIFGSPQRIISFVERQPDVEAFSYNFSGRRSDVMVGIANSISPLYRE